MPAISTRISSCRTDARRAIARAVALAFSAASLHCFAQLRLSHELQDHARGPDVAPPPATDALLLRVARRLGTEAPAATYEELLLEVNLNRQATSRSTVVLRRGDGMYLLKLEDLAEFRLKTPSTAPHLHEDIPYFPLDTLPGARFEMDETRQRLTVMAGPEAFESSVDVVPTGRKAASPVRASIGGFLNYDVAVIGGGGPAAASGTFEGGVFTPRGVFVTSMSAAHDGDGSRAVRLESTYTADFPGRRTTLRVGDAISRPGTWGTASHFGGLQYGTNFSTDPAFLTFPTQPIRGQAIVPSVLDIYVNNALVASRPVEPGPFTISNIPFTTGSGTVRTVMRDLNNREQVVTLSNPFYSSNTLLKQGLSDYSVEIGKAREDLAIESFHYGDAMASGTYRRGLTDSFTAEAHVEGRRDQVAAGLSATMLHAVIGQVDATLAASNSDAGSGRLAGLGYQRQANPLSFGGQLQWATPGFRRAGELEESHALRRMQTFAMGLQAGVVGSITASYIEQRFRDSSWLAIASLGYSRVLGSWGQFNLTALRTRGAQESVAVSASITMPLGPNRNASVQLERSEEGGRRQQQWLASFQRNRSGDSPYSYRVAARGSDVEGALEYRGDRFEAELAAARTESNVLTGRLQAAGGVGFLGDYVFLSRRIVSSFGVVKVADYAGVGVLFDNQFVGRTDSRGYFVVPELRPYDHNAIAIREADLPLDATVGGLKLDATPYFRSGILVEFPVKRTRAAVLTVVLEDGTPLPAGAIVRVENEPEEFPSAYHGEVYVNGLASRTRLVVEWKQQTCAIDVVYPDGTDPLPDLGRFICKGVRP